MRGRPNQKVCLILTILMVLGIITEQAWGKYGGGSGTASDPYLIYTAEQMNEIGLHQEDWDKHFKLMADIDLGSYTGTDFNIIGYSPQNAFNGTFDGNGHKIFNFSYSCIDGWDLGIFGYVNSPNALIKDLTLISPNIVVEEGGNIGSLIGYLSDGTVKNCFVINGNITALLQLGNLVGNIYLGKIFNCGAINCKITGDYSLIGGLAGHISSLAGPMSYCFSEGGSVTGKGEVGGLLGRNGGIDISYCYSTTNVSGEYLEGYSGFGGLIGGSQGSTISDCYATGNVQGYGSESGGLVGSLRSGNVTRCYSTGKVSGTGEIGGLIGGNNYGLGIITASFWDIETSGQTWSAGGIGKTTAEMQTKNTFTSAGWDFTTPIWTIDEGIYYLRLWWEKKLLYVPAEYPTIQDAIDAAVNGDTVIVAPGTYTGDGNRDIDFLGKAITVRSIDPNDPNVVAATVINCQQSGRGFYFHNSEGKDTILAGLMITGGYGLQEIVDPYTYSCGGAIYCKSSSPMLINCIFVSNAAECGGATMNYYGSYPTITSCTFSGNSAIDGGGMFNYQSSPTVKDCTFSENSVLSGGGMSNRESSPSVNNCIFSDNSALSGGGMFNYQSTPTVEDCTFSGNSGTGGVGMFNDQSSPTVKDCTFSSNWGLMGGGMLNCYYSSPIVEGCTFTANWAEPEGGGGMCNMDNSSPTVTNCTFTNNLADFGGAMDNYDSSRPTVTNCILWADAPSEISGSAIVTYSDVQGGYPGTGNIDADPLFVDANNDDYHLLPDSPCINAGDPNFIAEPNETDIDGELRIMLGRVDMGADEFNPFEVTFDVINKRRIDRTVFEYDCNVTLTNISRFAVRNVQLEIVKASNNMVIIDPNVTFGDVEIGPGQSASSIDTCSFQVDRSQAIEPAEIIWKSTCELLGSGQVVQDVVSGVSFLRLDNIAGDITGDGKVDIEDLAEIARQWLQVPGIPLADIEPMDGDGIVNFLDFAVLAEHWLEGQ